ncbi:MAG: hypothetical protein ABSE99_07895 [Terracidiphilus sp.]|jgi:hypothetical protein
MKKLALYFLALVLGTQTALVFAQTQEKPVPQFTLTISAYYHEFGPRFDRVSVRVTNTSNKVLLEPGCSDVRGLYVISVTYNGVPLKEKDAAARHRKEAEQSQFCTRELGVNEIKPGASFQRLFSVAERYDVSEPGTYEVAISRETLPDHPEKSVTVHSNTLTIVVPEPEAGAAK